MISKEIVEEGKAYWVQVSHIETFTTGSFSYPINYTGVGVVNRNKYYKEHPYFFINLSKHTTNYLYMVLPTSKI